MVRSHRVMIVVCFLSVIIFQCFPVVASGLPGDVYLIGPGDVLDISVWKNTELSKVVPVLPDGSISFPLVGEIQASGKTLSQFQGDLVKKLIKFIPNPSLFVVVRQTNIPIYVIGKVKNPGVFNLKANVNVLQSLTLAGGLNRFADRSDIRVMRKVSGKTEIYKFDYDEVSEGSGLEQNIMLQRGDVVVVP